MYMCVCELTLDKYNREANKVKKKTISRSHKQHLHTTNLTAEQHNLIVVKDKLN